MASRPPGLNDVTGIDFLIIIYLSMWKSDEVTSRIFNIAKSVPRARYSCVSRLHTAPSDLCLLGRGEIPKGLHVHDEVIQ